MKVWDELVSTALLGTEREPLPAMSFEGELGAVLKEIAGETKSSKEERLLRAAALLELYQRAGRDTPAVQATRPEPCLPESQPQCGARAGSLLSTLLNENNEAVLAEWIACARSNGKRIPDILLPPLLELGLMKARISKELCLSRGPRMLWLAKHNPRWSYVNQGTAESGNPIVAWETGELTERLAAMRATRLADPDAARDLLINSWAQESAEQRALFLKELRTGLSMNDEPFLEERALDDKRKEVRIVAQELLALLPQSRLSKRIIDRAVPHIKFIRVLLSQKYEFDYTFHYNPSMARDGITIGRQTDGVGEKTDLLQQFVSNIHPDFWTEHFNTDVRKLVDTAAKKQDSQIILLGGWQRAAAFHQAADWAQVLLPFVSSGFEELFACIEPSQQEALVLNLLRTVGGRIKSSPETVQLIRAFLLEERIFGTEVSLALLHACKTECTTDAYYNNPVVVMLPSLALRLNPAVVSEAMTGWRSQLMDDQHVRRVLDSFMATVQFRYDMYQSMPE